MVDVQGSTFDVRGSRFCVGCSTFNVQRSTFPPPSSLALQSSTGDWPKEDHDRPQFFFFKNPGGR